MKSVYFAFAAICFAALAHCEEEQHGSGIDSHRPGGDHVPTSTGGNHSSHHHPLTTGSSRPGTHHPERPPGGYKRRPTGEPKTGEPHSGYHDKYRPDGHKAGKHDHRAHDSDKTGRHRPGHETVHGENPDVDGKSDGQEGGDKEHNDKGEHHGRSRTKRAIFGGLLILCTVLVIVGVVFAVRRYRKRKRQQRTTEQQGVTYSQFANDEISLQDVEASPSSTKEKL